MKGSIHTDGSGGIKEIAKSFDIYADYIETNSYAEVFDLVRKGVADAGVVNRLFGKQNEDKYKLNATPLVFNPIDLKFAFNKSAGNSNSLINRIDENIRIMKQNNRLSEVILYFLSEEFKTIQRKISQLPNLTIEEKEWIENNSLIRVGIDRDFPPFEFLDKFNQYSGLASDYLKIISKKTGLRFEIEKNSTWSEVVEKFKRKELDICPIITETPERLEYLIFTPPYQTYPFVIITKDDSPAINSLEEIVDLKTAIVEGYASTELILSKYPKMNKYLVKDILEGLKAVAYGQADLMIGDYATSIYKIRNEGLSNLKISAEANIETKGFSFGIRKDWGILKDIISKTLQSITEEEHQKIKQKWITGESPFRANTLNFTEDELKWISEHPLISVLSHSNWTPIEYVDENNNLQGITLEYLKIFKKYTGCDFSVINTDLLDTMTNKLKAGEADLITAVPNLPENPFTASLLEPHLTIPVYFFADEKTPYINRLKDIRNKKIVLIQNLYLQHGFQDVFKDMKLIIAENNEEAFTFLKSGKADILVNDAFSTSYYLQKNRLLNYKIVGKIPIDINISFGVRDDLPHLKSILQKILDDIREEERDNINQRWISIRYELEPDYSLIFTIVIISLFILAVILYWNRLLFREIRIRKQTEHKLIETQSDLEKKNEELNSAKDSAIKANNAKSAFLASMSHELRTPLNSIIGFNSILLNEMAGPLNFEQKKQLKMVKGSSQHLLALINDVLDMSKIEAGELVLTITEVNYRNVILQAVNALHPLADAKNIKLDFEIDEQLEMIQCDERRILQVIINLINNAIKFSEKGVVKISAKLTNENVVTSVSDCGIGIKAEDVSKLFQPFTQLKTGTNREYEGSGLGLSISRKIIELLHGTIGVESKLGTGSTFTFTIPLNQEKTKRKDAE